MTAENSGGNPDGWSGSTSRSLLANVQDHDPTAWVRLVRLYTPLVALWCRRAGIAEQDRADVLQEVFAAVANNIGRFRKEQPHDTFRGWLSTIARNKVRDFYRRRADRPVAAGGTEASFRLAQAPDLHSVAPDCSPGNGTDDSDPDESAAFGEVLKRALQSIRGEFHELTWKAFWSVVVEGRAAADVATELGMQRGAVRVCKSRVLSRLRRELGDIES